MIAEIARFVRFARKVLIRVIISRMKYYKQVLAIESLHIENSRIIPSRFLAKMLADAIKGNPFFSYDESQARSVA